jgi:hypothetical protein
MPQTSSSSFAATAGRSSGRGGRGSGREHNGRGTDYPYPRYLTTNTSPQNNNFLTIVVSSSYQARTSTEEAVGEGVVVEALLDSGSLAGDFISEDLIARLKCTNKTYLKEINNLTVCSGLDNKCYDGLKTIDLMLTYNTEILNNQNTFKSTIFL